MTLIVVLLLVSPLALVLFSLSLGPFVCRKLWRQFEMPCLISVGTLSVILSVYFVENTRALLYHALVEDYLPFIITLFALYCLGRGIHLKIRAKPTPLNNSIFLACCGLFSSLIGTTGSSMLFLGPFLNMNKHRQHKTHLVVFFIFVVANIGGLLTPLGDPPLLLGYLHGVNFFWCFENLWDEWLVYVFGSLSVLYIIDKIKYKTENSTELEKIKFSITVRGKENILLLLGTIFVLFVDLGEKLTISNYEIPIILVKDMILLSFCAISLRNKEKRKIDFSAFREVAVTFFIIFIVLSPVIFLLEINSESIRKALSDFSTTIRPSQVYFLACGAISSLLDNAPSYLLFFKMAGGDAQALMNTNSDILRSISLSSVVMGAVTYVGNAPNMMIKSIAVKNGITMPSFIGYIGWSLCVIVALSLIVVFFL